MRLKLLGILALVFLVAGAAAAHGNKKHVVGTIEKINPGSLMVKTPEGADVEVKLVPTTAYVLRVDKTDKPAKAADLAVGQRVAIHATPHTTPNGETLDADEIKFSAGSSAHSPATAAAKPKP